MSCEDKENHPTHRNNIDSSLIGSVPVPIASKELAPLQVQTQDVDRQENQASETNAFPYSGIFAPHGFLSSIGDPDHTESQESTTSSISNSSSKAVAAPIKSKGIQIQVDNEKNTDKGGKGKRKLEVEVDEMCTEGDPSIADLETDADLEIVEKSSEKRGRYSPESPATSFKVPIHEIVLSFDHIREKIFKELKPPDLFASRLVCHQWNYYATPYLQKSVTIHFRENKLVSHYFYKKLINEHLAKLIELLKSEVASELFPCTKFIFENGSFDDQIFQDFLTIYGYDITDLNLDFYQDVKSAGRPNLSVVTEQLRNLLVNQAPNLLYLYLAINPIIDLKNEFKRDVKIEESSPNLNKSLKVFEMHRRPYTKLVEVVTQCAPNLAEIILAENFHFGKNWYKIFILPTNRLHFMKKLNVVPDISVNELEEYVLASQDAERGLGQEGCLALRDLSLMFYRFQEMRQNDPGSVFRIVNVVNRVLQCCQKSLMTLKWRGDTFPLGLKLPPNMENVWKLDLGNSPFAPSTEPNIFPEGFSFSETFPNLKCIGFFDFLRPYGDSYFDRLKSLGPALSVRSVFYGIIDNMKPIPSQYSQPIRTLFPNAVIYSVAFCHEFFQD